ncbi:putative bifunctional diguanylate cyclase/phosphodiesterase [Rhodobacter aestuarii]|uniref:putative bifunctional diguanylate cyclase/phosphodiesterase n=1 Tax=Rhodobacter aestuarii TaxID=453582 RepID=UPI0015E7204C|nr:GGDEF domain-containing phosphodiesterase [Rhodobacter aestuarii]
MSGDRDTVASHNRHQDLYPRACTMVCADAVAWSLRRTAEGGAVLVTGAGAQPMQFSDFAKWFVPDDRAQVLAFLERELAQMDAPVVQRAPERLMGRMRWNGAGDEAVLTSIEISGRELPGQGMLLRLDTSFDATRANLDRIGVSPAMAWSITYPDRGFEVAESWKARLGYAAEDLPDFSLEGWAAISHPEDVAAFESEAVQMRLRAGEPFQLLSRMRHRNGAWISFLSFGRAVRWDAQGNVTQVMGCDLDMTAFSVMENALLQERERLAHVLEALPSGKVVLDAEGQVVFSNPEASALLDIGPSKLMGHNFAALLQLEEGREDFEDALKDPETLGSLRLHRKRAGRRQVLQVDLAPMPDPNDHERVLVSLNDITQLFDLQRQLEQSIENARFIATHDLMTGLPDRYLAMRVVDEHIRRLESAHEEPEANQLAVLCIEFDNFRLINDTLGHETADQLIKSAAKRLEVGLPDGAVLARVNEGEFVVLLPGADALAAESRGWEIVRAFARPLHLPQRHFFLTASIGASRYPDDGQSAEALMRAADMAMHRSQARGRNTVTMFSREIGGQFERRSAVAQALHRGLEAGRFELFLQPQFDVTHGIELVGAEALLRLTDAELGPISPGEFIPVAEVDGLVAAIDLDVMRLAGAMLTGWAARGIDLPIAINLNAATLDEPGRADLPERLMRAGLSPTQVMIELTETGLAAPIAQRKRNLRRLEEAGYRISVDDFGTGQSALGALQHLPVAELKIDRSFVQALDGEEPARALAIVRAILAMAESLGLHAIAEGVETERQFDMLRAEGCTLMQGFLLGRPVDLRSFEAMYLPQQRARVREQLRGLRAGRDFA